MFIRFPSLYKPKITGSYTNVVPPADYYVDSARPDDTGNGLTPATAKKYITSGMALMTGQTGKILQIQNGTYAHANDLINTNAGSGSSGTYNTVRAETIGGVTINVEFVLPVTTTYLIFNGLKWANNLQRTIEGTYIKFFNCMFKGGQSSGNVAKLRVGTNNVTENSTHHILLEDCLIYGFGGRYGVSAYQSTQIIFRRVVFRIDGGWDSLGSGNPEAACVFYNNNNSSFQNCIANPDAAGNWQSAFYSIYNSASNGTTDNCSWRGCIALNNKKSHSVDGASLRFDIGGGGSQTNMLVTDSIPTKSYWGINLSFQGTIQVTIDRFTVLQTVREAGKGIGGSSAGTKTVSNGIIKGFDTDDVQDISPTYINTFNNGASYSGTGSVTYDPQLNGLSQCNKIDVGSPLKTAGSGGGQIGAEITKRWGTSGTVHGETGWDSITTDDLFPLPNEDLWKTCCQEGSITRGFAGSSGTLSEYIVNFI